MFKKKELLWVWSLAIMVLCSLAIGCDVASPTVEETLDKFVSRLNKINSFSLNFGLAVNGAVASSEGFGGIGFPGLDIFEGGSNTSTNTDLAPSIFSPFIRVQALGWQGPTSLPGSISSEYCSSDSKCENDANWYSVELPKVAQLGGGDLSRYLRTTPPGNPDIHSDPTSVTRLDEVATVTGVAPGGKYEIKWDIYLEENATDSTTYDGAYKVTALTIDDKSNNSSIEITFTGLTVGDDSISGTLTEKVTFRVPILGTTTFIGIGGSSTFDNFGADGGGSGYLFFGTDPGSDGPWAEKESSPTAVPPFTSGILVKFNFDPVGDIEAGGYKIKYDTYLSPGDTKVYPPE